MRVRMRQPYWVWKGNSNSAYFQKILAEIKLKIVIYRKLSYFGKKWPQIMRILRGSLTNILKNTSCSRGQGEPSEAGYFKGFLSNFLIVSFLLRQSTKTISAHICIEKAPIFLKQQSQLIYYLILRPFRNTRSNNIIFYFN